MDRKGSHCTVSLEFFFFFIKFKFLVRFRDRQFRFPLLTQAPPYLYIRYSNTNDLEIAEC